MNKIIQTTTENSCGKKGCRIYVLPYGSTKEVFIKFVDDCVEDQKEDNEQPVELKTSRNKR